MAKTAKKDHRSTLKAVARKRDTPETVLELREDNLEASGLDPKTYALVKVAALIALDAAPASFIWQVEMAREAGVTEEELTGLVIALAPQIGLVKTVAAAPELALAMGIDFEPEAEERGSNRDAHSMATTPWHGNHRGRGRRAAEAAAEQIREAGKEKKDVERLRLAGTPEIMETLLRTLVATSTAFGGHPTAMRDAPERPVVADPAHPPEPHGDWMDRPEEPAIAEKLRHEVDEGLVELRNASAIARLVEQNNERGLEVEEGRVGSYPRQSARGSSRPTRGSPRGGQRQPFSSTPRQTMPPGPAIGSPNPLLYELE
jgi:4-carboxymuconolactone decarboxylase